MEPEANVCKTALDIIRSANLTPTEHLILEKFLDEAVDPSYAARYLLQRLNENPGRDTEAGLRVFEQDWKRLVSKFTKCEEIPLHLQSLLKRRDSLNCCCMVIHRDRLDKNATFNVEPAWIIPPSIFDDDELTHNSPLLLLLEGFLTPDGVRRLQSILQACTEEAPALQNLFLLSPAVHSAFRDGRVQITRGLGPNPPKKVDINSKEIDYLAITCPPEECTGLTLSNGDPFNGYVHMFTMYTQDPSLYCLPSEELFRMHFKIATALHLFFVEDRISTGWTRPSYVALNKTACKIIRRCWHFVPKFIRVWCYHILLKIGKRLYSPHCSAVIHQLPLGLYLKPCFRSRFNEAKALQIVEKYTSITAPLCVDTFEDKGKVMLVMTRIRGDGLNKVFHRLSYQQREQLSIDLGMVVKQLRMVPNTTPYRLANALGGPLLDVRLPETQEGPCGPYNKCSDFHNYLIHKYVWPKTKESVAAVHSQEYRSFFTHADLNPTNIMIDQGKLSGILDWECAGFYPEYWEFTKGIYCVENDKAREKIIRDAFPDDNYEDELKAEKLLWRETPLGL
ncbi:hypothetical protein MferCBS31731_004990 [Microsporum ferrugineum]